MISFLTDKDFEFVCDEIIQLLDKDFDEKWYRVKNVEVGESVVTVHAQEIDFQCYNSQFQFQSLNHFDYTICCEFVNTEKEIVEILNYPFC